MTDDDHVEQATTLKGRDAPNGKRLDGYEQFSDYYNRLSVANSLDFNGKWRKRRRETRKNASAILDAVAAQLELTDYQKAEAHRLFANLPNDYNEAYATALLAFCTCGIVGRRDGRDYHPNKLQHESDNPTHFEEYFHEIPGSHSELYSCWSALEGEFR